ncbi:unnamed protein product [Dovyalis caffra]|uniref:Uncharacterized protein n=1 Tax=Dovyalis caffra TaxID=77055 RepID=A0AAV1RNM9_9ROSI|nr:unnamed protein product [Dovyalis caffra]
MEVKDIMIVGMKTYRSRPKPGLYQLRVEEEVERSREEEFLGASSIVGVKLRASSHKFLSYHSTFGEKGFCFVEFKEVSINNTDLWVTRTRDRSWFFDLYADGDMLIIAASILLYKNLNNCIDFYPFSNALVDFLLGE